jgi:hypothetical protein
MFDYLTMEAHAGDILRELRAEALHTRLVQEARQQRQSPGGVIVLLRAGLLALGAGLTQHSG